MAEVAANTVVDDRYRILSRIGSGGMADVYCAEDTHLGRQVALKVLHRRFARDTEFVERFRREASAAAGLQHPHVVNVFDRGEHDGTYYIAMEYLKGETLKELITSEAPLPQERAIEIAIQILRAAGFAHKRGVIHRDFKPHNVMVGPQGGIKVTDFGIARAGASEMTETGSIMGTAQYLSPEQAQGHAVSAASDLYSIGVIVYEMLAGRVPFTGDSAVSIALKHLSEPPPRLASLRRDVNPTLEGVVMRALAKQPEQRYASADEFIAGLEAARAAIGSGDNGGQDTAAFTAVAAGPPVAEATWMGPPPEEPFEERGARWRWIALILLVLALAGLGAYELTRPDRVRVPSEVGRTVDQASADLGRRGFDVNVARKENNAPADQVISQDPDAGTKTDKGSTVTLGVSSGPGQRTVPTVQGLSLRTATKRLTKAGFAVDSQSESSSTVPKGQVIRTDPDQGTRQDAGSRIRVFISSGAEQVQVPDVVGLDISSARSRLHAAGFDYTTNEVESDQPKGRVLSQQPAKGTTVDKGSRVTLQVSKGRTKVDVPDVEGMSASDAAAKLSAAGFQVDQRTKRAGTPEEDGQVLHQTPAGGAQLAKGRTVRIYVGSFQAPAGNGSPPTQTPPGQ